MPSTDRIHARMMLIDCPTVDQAMIDALLTAEPADARKIIRMLLERRNRDALVRLIGLLDQLDPSVAAWASARLAAMPGTLRTAATNHNRTTRMNLVDLIGRSSSAEHAYLLSQQLNVRDGRITRAAAGALLRLTGRATGRSVDTGIDATDHDESSMLAVRLEGLPQRRLVTNAVADACGSFHHHRRRDVLLAVGCLAPVVDPSVWRWLDDRHAAAYPALAEMISQANEPLIRRALPTFASRTTLQPSVLRALGRIHGGEEFDDLLEQAHLTLAPAVRQTLSRSERPSAAIPSPAHLKRLGSARIRQLIHLIDGLAVGAGQAADLLEAVSSSDDRLTRLMCLRHLMKIDHRHADRAVAAMCFDCEATIARTALRHLQQRKWAGLPALLIRLSTSTNPAIRRMAETLLGPLGFEGLWRKWPTMNNDVRRAAGRILLRLDGKVHKKLATRMNDTDPAIRLQAVNMVRHLNQESYFIPVLQRLANDDDAAVASSAVKALSAITDSPEAVSIAEQCLMHNDDRVRSNAIECLDAMGRIDAYAESLRVMSRAGGNRSRATAICRLTRTEPSVAGQALEEMLCHRDERHRTSALWAARQTGARQMLRRLVTMAQLDPVASVRRDAARTARVLAGSKRKGRMVKASAVAQLAHA
jgi:hypothetical protein